MLRRARRRFSSSPWAWLLLLLMAAASHPVAGQAPAVVLCQDSTTYDLDGFTAWPVNGNPGPHGMAGMSSDGLGKITVTALDVYWSSNMTVRGTVRVPAGHTLHITKQMDGTRTVIQFADTRQTVTLAQLRPPYDRATRIVVERRNGNDLAGNLYVGENVTLTSLQGCPNSMWDGIVLQGTTEVATGLPLLQSDDQFGEAQIGNSAFPTEPVRIENARLGVLAGRPQYSNVDGRLLTSYADGGGLLLVENTEFLNCHTGITLLNYSRTQNQSTVQRCKFRSDTPLVDPLYVTSGGIRYGTQTGVYLSGVQGILFRGNLFELIDNNAAFNSMELPYNLRGIGISLNNAYARVLRGNGMPNVFKRLATGINANNPDPSYSLQVVGNVFDGNYTGVWMANTTGAIVQNNKFYVGRQGDAYAPGLRIDASRAFLVTGNTFSARCTTWPTGKAGQTLRGAEFWGLEAAADGIVFDEVYRNQFDSLSDGMLISTTNRRVTWQNAPAMAPVGNRGLQIKCNDFRSKGQPGAIKRHNLLVQVYLGTGDPALNFLQGLPNQGACPDPLDPRLLTAPAGNLFSHGTTCAGITARDIQQVGGGTLPFDYRHHPEIAGFPTRPGGNFGCLNAASATATPCQAPLNGLGFNDFCPPTTGSSTATEAALLAQADTAAAAADRQAAINELLRRYLNDSVDVMAGVAAARAMLTQLNEPAYVSLRQALDARLDAPAQRLGAAVGGEGNSRTAGHPAARQLSRRKEIQAAASAVAQARTLYADYSDRIRALLAPYDTDSAAQQALRTNAPLRAEILRIARDSTTYGFTEGRAVLTQYLGYRFVDGRLDAIGADTDGTGQRAAPTPRTFRPDVATFYPNPTADGHLRVAYTLPATQSARLELTDRYGVTRLTQSLKTHAVEAELNLSALPAGLYQYRLRVGEEVVQSGTLVRLP